MNTRFRKLILASVTSAAIVLTGCATDGSLNRGQTGAAIGAAAGAIFGHQVDGKKGRYVGAVVGALAGNAVGRYMDEQQSALERELSQEQAANEIQISRMADNSLKLNLSSEVSFDFDSASIRGDFRDSLNKVANVLADYPSTAVHILGHTDSVGSDQYNQQLSVRRASSVQGYLSRQGVDATRTRTRGYGETMPVSDNATAVGRQQNRRVEIYLKPIVEGRERAAYQSPV